MELSLSEKYKYVCEPERDKGTASCYIVDKTTNEVIVHSVIRATTEIKSINSEYLEGNTRKMASRWIKGDTQEHNPKKTIMTLHGEAHYLTTEVEDQYGHWNDSLVKKVYPSSLGFYVIHHGKYHDVYKL